MIVSNSGDITVCIVRPSKFTYSETFIDAHVKRLPGKINTLYGYPFPAFTEDDRRLVSFFQRGTAFVVEKVCGVKTRYFHNKALANYLRKERVDAVLAEYGTIGVSVMEACQAACVPLIVHFHGFDAYHHGTLEKFGKVYPQLFQVSAAIIAVSRGMEQQLLNHGAPRNKLFYNPCGVDATVFLGGNLATSSPLFLAVGRFVDKKAPHLTILAFKKVVARVPDAKLIMIGDGPLWEACKQLADAMGIGDTVQFLGLRTHSDVAAKMREARAFVQHSIRTSYGDSEGTPVAILEAGATGLPVVATLHAGIQDVVIDGQTGLLVAEGDIKGMAECMIRLARDPVFAARLGNAAKERISAEFSIDKSISSLWSIIKTAIRENQNPCEI